MNASEPRLDIWHGDNLCVLKTVQDKTFDLIYVDPPFNTRKTRTRASYNFCDKHKDYMSFLKFRFDEAYRILKDNGSLFVHLDYREVHYVKVMLDGIFGRKSFMNEIIWSYDFGGRSKKKWSTKHDNILWYAKDPKNYTFNYDEMDRIPYMAPGLAGKKKVARGKTPTDSWWHTIVHTNGFEKTGYPTQKPIGIIDRIVKVHSNPGDYLLDFFAGSGTFGESAYWHGRNCVLIDDNIDAITVMQMRFMYLAEPRFCKIGV